MGGAKFADGLRGVLPAGHLTVIVNTGDDFEHLGLKICPDLDTVCYTLAGIANPQTGWGLKDETFAALESVKALGGPDWFHVGDRDLGTHLERTRRLRLGQRLSEVTEAFCRLWGVPVTGSPMPQMTPCPRWCCTEKAELPFQEYFVHQECQPAVRGFRFEGVERAKPAPGVLEALRQADLVLILPIKPMGERRSDPGGAGCAPGAFGWAHAPGVEGGGGLADHRREDGQGSRSQDVPGAGHQPFGAGGGRALPRPVLRVCAGPPG